MTRFKPRERRLLLVTSILIGCLVLVSWIVVPLGNRASDLEQRVVAQTLKVDTLSRLLAHQLTIEQTYQAVSSYLSEDGEEVVEAAFLADLERLAHQANVQLNLKPKPTKQEGHLRHLGVELDFHATQEQLFMFLDLLLRMPRLVQIERLHIASAPGKPDLLRTQLLLEQLTFHP